MKIKLKLVFSHLLVAGLLLGSTAIAIVGFLMLERTIEEIVYDEVPVMQQVQKLALHTNRIIGTAPLLLTSKDQEAYEPIKEWIASETDEINVLLEKNKSILKGSYAHPELFRTFFHFQSSLDSIDQEVQNRLEVKRRIDQRIEELESLYNRFENLINPAISLYQYNLHASLDSSRLLKQEELEAALALYEVRKVGYALNNELLIAVQSVTSEELTLSRIKILSYLTDLADLRTKMAPEILEEYNALLESYYRLYEGDDSVLVLQEKHLMHEANAKQLMKKSREIAQGLTDFSDSLLQQSETNINNSVESVLDIHASYFNLLIFIAGFSVFLAAFLGGFFVSRRIIRPIERLVYAAEKIRTGDRSARVRVESDDELGMMAREFNAMADDVQNALKELEGHRDHLEMLVRERTEEVTCSMQQLKEAQAQLIQQEKLVAMSEVLNNIAHQWRQPITSIGLIMANVRDDFEEGALDADGFESQMDKVDALLQRISRTIDEFRIFFASGEEKEPFYAQDVVRDCLELLKTSIEEASIQIEFTIGGDREIVGFRHEYAQVVQNILTNAKEALMQSKQEEKKIMITVGTSEDNRSKLIIEDNGPGIPEEIFGNVFEPYFTTKFKSDGTGIGLYMSKMVIEKNMGGEILAENVETGARFTVIV